MSYSTGTGGGAAVTAASPEDLVDRAEAHLADADIELDSRARAVLRATIQRGVEREQDYDLLEGTLDAVVDNFIIEFTNTGARVVNARRFKRIWGKVCIYPWCRRAK